MLFPKRRAQHLHSEDLVLLTRNAPPFGSVKAGEQAAKPPDVRNERRLLSHWAVSLLVFRAVALPPAVMLGGSAGLHSEAFAH